MKIIAREVKTYEETAYCECGGVMLSTSKCFTSFPAQYEHVCSKCKKEKKPKTYLSKNCNKL